MRKQRLCSRYIGKKVNRTFLFQLQRKQPTTVVAAILSLFLSSFIFFTRILKKKLFFKKKILSISRDWSGLKAEEIILYASFDTCSSLPSLGHLVRVLHGNGKR